jgi:L-aminopeptidase/D-esterase-like protein
VITDVAGVRVGHWTHAAARTGCTVALLPEGTVASGEVRGGAPAARETALLGPTATVAQLDAVVLTGGSAFGLAAADGVLRFCEEQGRGVPTPVGPVPIVVALACFDLAVGDPSVRPGPDEGYAACLAAADGPVDLGPVGGGTGATVGGAHRGDERRPGGLASATARSGDLVVASLVVVNAFGAPDVGDDTAPQVAGMLQAAGQGWRSGDGGDDDDGDGAAGGDAGLLGNTVIGLVATNARLDKVGCHLVAQSGHDGLARAIFPAHTRLDGDAFVAASCGRVGADVDAVRALAVHAVADAIRRLDVPTAE